MAAERSVTTANTHFVSVRTCQWTVKAISLYQTIIAEQHRNQRKTIYLTHHAANSNPHWNLCLNIRITQKYQQKEIHQFMYWDKKNQTKNI